MSDDGGATWQVEPTFGLPLTKSSFWGLAIDPANRDMAVAATDTGIYVRLPKPGGGFHWKQSITSGSSTGTPSVVAARKASKTTFFIVQCQEGKVSSWSPDGSGADPVWTVVGTGFPG